MKTFLNNKAGETKPQKSKRRSDLEGLSIEGHCTLLVYGIHICLNDSNSFLSFLMLFLMNDKFKAVHHEVQESKKADFAGKIENEV